MGVDTDSSRTQSTSSLRGLEKRSSLPNEGDELLRKKGFKAQRIEEGVPDWRARNWRVEGEQAGAGS